MKKKTMKERFKPLIKKVVENIVAAITQWFLVVLVGGSAAAIYAFAKKTFDKIVQLLTEPSPLWVTILLIILYALYARLLRKKKKHQILVDIIFVGGSIVALVVAALLSHNGSMKLPSTPETMVSRSPGEVPQPQTEITRSPEETKPPQPEKAKKTEGKVFLKETFSDNSRNWSTGWWGGRYEMEFKDARYVIDRHDGKPYLSSILVKDFSRWKNFDLELSTIWRSGMTDMWYGLACGVDGQTYYTFVVSADGHAMISKFENDKSEPIFLPIKLKSVLVRKADSFVFNRLKIEVRSEKISYYVDDVRIGEIINAISFDQLLIGVFVVGKQKVAFDNLILTVW